MAPQKTKFPKKPQRDYLEPDLKKLCKKLSTEHDDRFHDDGSCSEFMRRGIKSYILSILPRIKHNKNYKHIDWDEAY